MVNELKVYNSFGELTLHLRLSLGQNVELLTVDGTDDMRAAVTQLRGDDFDRTIAKSGELVRLTANWGSQQYLPVLARYFGLNFGWRTQTIQTDENASPTAEPTAVLLNKTRWSSGNASIVFTNVSEYRPDSSPKIDFYPVPETIPVKSSEPEMAIYGISAD